MRLNLGLSRCRGRCYDGASNMTGKKNGVATQILKLDERALFTHCYGHSFNLTENDVLKVVPVMKDAFDVTYEICKLIQFFPRREAMFDKLKSDTAPGTPGIRILCPARWTVRAQSLKSIIDNYEVLLDLLDDYLDVVKEAEVRSRNIGVQAQMSNFSFYWGINLGDILRREYIVYDLGRIHCV